MLVAVACFLVEELLVEEREHRAVAVDLQGDRHPRLPLGRALPRPSEHELLVRHHLAVDAADIMLLAVRRAHVKVVVPAHARFGLGAGRYDLLRPNPARYFFGVGPRGIDFFGRRIETTFEGEAWFDVEFWLGGHDSSSMKAARRSSRSVQKRW